MADVVKVSDAIAQFLKEKEIKHVFGIIGSANSHIFDSITNLGYTEIICVHHEQAATMAMQTYFKVSGKVTAAIITAGGGSVNGITGVLSAWADSNPGIVISGQENKRFIEKMKGMRMWGIQGFDSSGMVKEITKFSTMVMDPKKALSELEKGYFISQDSRPGPVWIDYPMDIQGSRVLKEDLIHFNIPKKKKAPSLNKEMNNVFDLISKAKRPVFWFGNGIRLSKAENLIEDLLDKIPFPTLVSWAGIDMLDTDHPLNYGRPGVYGTRAANLVIQNSDLVISIGNRMSILMIGYEQSEFAREAKIVQIDIDQTELEKTKSMVDISFNCDAGDFITKLVSYLEQQKISITQPDKWYETCNGYRNRYPFIGPEHEDKNGFINSYKFMDQISNYLKKDQIVVTDMGTGLLSGHQALRIKQGQRLMTSTGLGEMGYGLPGAIGASVARNKGEVLCLNCDGGMMMNLQEIQTLVHHQLPIKLFIFNNDGYLMIKHTQKNLFEGRYSGTNKSSGVSCPDFSKLSAAFNISYHSIRTWKDFHNVIPKIQEYVGPVICDVFTDPEQFFHPKQSIAIQKDGTIVSPPLEDLSPLLDREVLEEEMVIDLHPKSKGLK